MRTLEQAIQQIKMFKIFMNDESIDIIIAYVSGLFNVDTEVIINSL